MIKAEPGGILWLDLSTTTGWAYGHTADVCPAWGVWVMPGMADLGRFGAAFENELCDSLHKFQPRLVGIEAAIPAHFQKSEQAAIAAMSLATLTHTTCWRWERRLVVRASATVRSGVLGTSQFPKGRVKDAVLQWCIARGWDITDHNARDAALGLAYEFGVRAPRPSRRQAA